MGLVHTNACRCTQANEFDRGFIVFHVIICDQEPLWTGEFDCLLYNACMSACACVCAFPKFLGISDN